MSETTVVAKPGPREIAEALERELPASSIARAISEALTATTVTKSGASIIDHRSRLAAAELALRYTVGLPVQRTESINVNLDAESSVGLAERLARSPALREQIRKALQAADEVNPPTA